MEPARNSQAPPRDALPYLLLAVTVTTGIVDAVTVIGLGNVFVALMTGNVIFIGLALAGVPGFEASHNAAALLAFIAGAGLAGWMAPMLAAGSRRRTMIRIAAVEAALLLAASFAARGYDIELLEPRLAYFAVIVLLGVAMGFRNSTVKKLGVADVPTTVMTLTIASLASDLAARHFSALPRRLGSIACLMGGALAGALLVLHAGVATALLATGVLVIAATAIYAAHPSSAIAAAGHS